LILLLRVAERQVSGKLPTAKLYARAVGDNEVELTAVAHEKQQPCRAVPPLKWGDQECAWRVAETRLSRPDDGSGVSSRLLFTAATSREAIEVALLEQLDTVPSALEDLVSAIPRRELDPAVAAALARVQELPAGGEERVAAIAQFRRLVDKRGSGENLDVAVMSLGSDLQGVGRISVLGITWLVGHHLAEMAKTPALERRLRWCACPDDGVASNAVDVAFSLLPLRDELPRLTAFLLDALVTSICRLVPPPSSTPALPSLSNPALWRLQATPPPEAPPSPTPAIGRLEAPPASTPTIPPDMAAAAMRERVRPRAPFVYRPL